MAELKPSIYGYLLAAGLGAVGGGLLVMAVAKVIPKMMEQMGSSMMSNMIAGMQESGCDPVEF